MAKRISFQKVKSNQTYTVEEAADVLTVTQQTVRTWIKAGLPALCARRPLLILGFEMRIFLQARADNAKQADINHHLFHYFLSQLLLFGRKRVRRS